MHLPLVVTLVITLGLEQVFQSVVMHVAIQYRLDFVLLFAIDESCGWGWCRSSARDGIRKRQRQLDYGEDGVGGGELGDMRHGLHKLRQRRGPGISERVWMTVCWWQCRFHPTRLCPLV
jgi:hypothetical protein